jgi:chromate transporter
MGKSLCPDAPRAAFALAVAAILIVAPSGVMQLATIAAGAIFGLLVLKGENGNGGGEALASSAPRWAARFALLLFFALLFGLPVLAEATGSGSVALMRAFYQAGALVFGGGHVVLPLLEEAVVPPGWMARDAFLAGYGAAQAVPGPLFTFAGYLGTLAAVGPGGVAGAALALAAIFLPGILLIYGAMPYWDRLRRNATVRAALGGVNAAVVGLLGAALYNPIWTSAIERAEDAALALVLFALFAVLRLPVLFVVVCGALGGLLLTMM